MIEELEDYHSPIPNVRMIRQITVPRWAVDEEQPAISAIPDPEEEETSEHFFSGRSRRSAAMLVGSPYDVAPEPEATIPEFQQIESRYDEKGFLIDKLEYQSGRLTHRERFSYDANGRLARKVNEDHIDENLEKEERQYDSDGRVRKKTVTYSDGSTQITDYQWLDNSVERITSSDEGVDSRDKQTYDAAGRLIESLDIDPESGATSGLFQEYDPSGNLLTIGIIEADGTRWISETYEYDDQHNEIAWAAFDQDGNTVQERLSTFENGNCIEQHIMDSDGETIVSQDYDDANHLLHSTATGPSIQSETVCLYTEIGQPALRASRTMQTGRAVSWGGSSASASTSWWEYEFFTS